ncbi:MAG: hypothetical protein R3B99_20610 [Polyangiales bacterium]
MRPLVCALLVACAAQGPRPIEAPVPPPRSLDGCREGVVLGHARLEGAQATLLAIGLHRVLVRDDLAGVAISAASASLIHGADLGDRWLFVRDDLKPFLAADALGPLVPLSSTEPELTARILASPRRYEVAPPQRGAVVHVDDAGVVELDRFGVHEVQTPWPVVDAWALGPRERLVWLPSGHAVRGPWDALRSVPSRDPWQRWRIVNGTLAVKASDAWTANQRAMPRPRCLATAEPVAARARVWRELLARDATPFVAGRFESYAGSGTTRTRLDGTEATLLGGVLYRRAPSGSVSSVVVPGAWALVGDDPSGFVLRAGPDEDATVVRVGDDDVVHRRREPVTEELRDAYWPSWHGTCADGSRTDERVCGIGPDGALHELAVDGAASLQWCGENAVIRVGAKKVWIRDPDGREAMHFVDGGALHCGPGGRVLLVADERLTVLHGAERVDRALPAVAYAAVVGARGDVVIRTDGGLLHGRALGASWRFVRVGRDVEPRCGADGCVLVGGAERVPLDDVSESPMPSERSPRFAAYPPWERTEYDEQPTPHLRCTTPSEASASAHRWRTSGELDYLVDVDAHPVFVQLRPSQAHAFPSALVLQLEGERDQCQGCATWGFGVDVARTRDGIAVMVQYCLGHLLQFDASGTQTAARRWRGGGVLGLRDGHPYFVVYATPDRSVAFPIDPEATPELLPATRASRTCAVDERGPWTLRGDVYVEGLEGTAVVEVSPRGACVSAVETLGGRLEAVDDRFEGRGALAGTTCAWVP